MKRLAHLILLLFLGCTQHPKSFIESPSYTESIKIDPLFDTLMIPIDSAAQIYYQKHVIVTDSASTNYLIGYNQEAHSLDIFNLSERLLIKRIILDREGVDAVTTVYGIYSQSLDSIYLLDRLALKLVNRDSKIIQTYGLSVDRPSENLTGYFISFNEARFKISGDGKKLTGYFVNEAIRGENRTREALREPMIADIDLTTGDISFHDIPYSSFIVENNGDFSSEITPNITYSDEEIFYGFPVESNIYRYRISSRTTQIIGAKSKFSENAAIPYSQSKSDFRLTGTWFNSLNRDPYSGLYYRTHWGSQPEKTIDNQPADAYSKPGYIMFFNKKFEVVDEIPIHKDLWLEDSFHTSEGIHFWMKPTALENERFLVIGRYKVSVIQRE